MAVAEIRGDPEAMARLAKLLSEASDAVRATTSAARLAAETFTHGGAWPDMKGRAVADRMVEAAGRIDRAAAELSQITATVDSLTRAYGLAAEPTPSSTPGVVQGSRPVKGSIDAGGDRAPVAAVPRVPRPTGEIITRGGQAFEVWSFACVDPTSIDWGADPDFPSKFGSETWKGHSPDDYRSLTQEVSALLDACRAGGPDEVPQALGRPRDSYFGTEPVRLEMPKSGGLFIANGRHRVMAAIEAGASIPVSVWRA